MSIGIPFKYIDILLTHEINVIKVKLFYIFMSEINLIHFLLHFLILMIIQYIVEKWL